MADDFDDFNFDLDGPDVPAQEIQEGKVAKVGRAVLGGAGSVAGGAFAAVKDMIPEYETQNTRTVLSEISGYYNDIKATKDEVWKTASQGWNTIKGMALKMMPMGKKIMPQKWYDGLHGWLKDHYEPEDEEESEESRRRRAEKEEITNALQAIFNQQHDQGEVNYAREQVKEARETARFKAQNQLTTAIYQRVDVQTKFFQGPFTEYLKKDLELKFQHLFVAKQTNTTVLTMAKVMENNLRAITHNTGLQDQMKQGPTAVSRGMKWLAGDRIDRFFSGIGDRFRKVVSEKLEVVKNALDMASGMGGMMDEEMLAQMAPDKKDAVLAVVKKLSEWGTKWKYGDLITRIWGTYRGLDQDVGNLRSKLRRKVYLAAKKKSEDYGGLADFISGLFPETDKQTTIRDDLEGKRPTDAVAYDLSSRSALVEVIPRHLERIGNVVEALQLKLAPDVKIPDKVFDKDSRSLVNRMTLINRVMTKQFGTDYDRSKEVTRAIAGIKEGAFAAKQVTETMRQTYQSEEFNVLLKKVIDNCVSQQLEWMPELIEDYEKRMPVTENPDELKASDIYYDEWGTKVFRGIKPIDVKHLVQFFYDAVHLPDGQVDEEALENQCREIDGLVNRYSRIDTYQRLVSEYHVNLDGVKGLKRNQYGNLAIDDMVSGLETADVDLFNSNVTAIKDNNQTMARRQEQEEDLAKMRESLQNDAEARAGMEWVAKYFPTLAKSSGMFQTVLSWVGRGGVKVGEYAEQAKEYYDEHFSDSFDWLVVKTGGPDYKAGDVLLVANVLTRSSSDPYLWTVTLHRYAFDQHLPAYDLNVEVRMTAAELEKKNLSYSPDMVPPYEAVKYVVKETYGSKTANLFGDKYYPKTLQEIPKTIDKWRTDAVEFKKQKAERDRRSLPTIAGSITTSPIAGLAGPFSGVPTETAAEPVDSKALPKVENPPTVPSTPAEALAEVSRQVASTEPPVAKEPPVTETVNPDTGEITVTEQQPPPSVEVKPAVTEEAPKQPVAEEAPQAQAGKKAGFLASLRQSIGDLRTKLDERKKQQEEQKEEQKPKEEATEEQKTKTAATPTRTYAKDYGSDYQNEVVETLHDIDTHITQISMFGFGGIGNKLKGMKDKAKGLFGSAWDKTTKFGGFLADKGLWAADKGLGAAQWLGGKSLGALHGLWKTGGSLGHSLWNLSSNVGKGMWNLGGKALKAVNIPGMMSWTGDKLGWLGHELFNREGWVRKTAGGLGKGIWDTLSGAGRTALSWLKLSEQYVDIYLKDKIEPGNPLLSAKKQKEGVIFVDGTKVERSDEIDKPVLDPETNNTLITEEDINTGLVDINNKPIKKGFIRRLFAKLKSKVPGAGLLSTITGGIGSAGHAVWDAGTGALKWLRDKLFGSGKVAAQRNSTLIGRLFGIEGHEIKKYHKDVLERLDRIIDIMDGNEKDKDGNGFSEGSIEDQKADAEEKLKKLKEKGSGLTPAQAAKQTVANGGTLIDAAGNAANSAFVSGLKHGLGWIASTTGLTKAWALGKRLIGRPDYALEAANTARDAAKMAKAAKNAANITSGVAKASGTAIQGMKDAGEAAKFAKQAAEEAKVLKKAGDVAGAAKKLKESKDWWKYSKQLFSQSKTAIGETAKNIGVRAGKFGIATAKDMNTFRQMSTLQKVKNFGLAAKELGQSAKAAVRGVKNAKGVMNTVKALKNGVKGLSEGSRVIGEIGPLSGALSVADVAYEAYGGKKAIEKAAATGDTSALDEQIASHQFKNQGVLGKSGRIMSAYASGGLTEAALLAQEAAEQGAALMLDNANTEAGVGAGRNRLRNEVGRQRKKMSKGLKKQLDTEILRNLKEEDFNIDEFNKSLDTRINPFRWFTEDYGEQRAAARQNRLQEFKSNVTRLVAALDTSKFINTVEMKTRLFNYIKWQLVPALKADDKKASNLRVSLSELLLEKNLDKFIATVEKDYNKKNTGTWLVLNVTWMSKDGLIQHAKAAAKKQAMSYDTTDESKKPKEKEEKEEALQEVRKLNEPASPANDKDKKQLESINAFNTLKLKIATFCEKYATDKPELAKMAKRLLDEISVKDASTLDMAYIGKIEQRFNSIQKEAEGEKDKPTITRFHRAKPRSRKGEKPTESKTTPTIGKSGIEIGPAPEPVVTAATAAKHVDKGSGRSPERQEAARKAIPEWDERIDLSKYSSFARDMATGDVYISNKRVPRSLWATWYAIANGESLHFNYGPREERGPRWWSSKIQGKIVSWIEYVANKCYMENKPEVTGFPKLERAWESPEGYLEFLDALEAAGINLRDFGVPMTRDGAKRCSAELKKELEGKNAKTTEPPRVPSEILREDLQDKYSPSEVVDRIKGLQNENAVVYDRDGNVLETDVGNRDSVAVSSLPPGSHVVHNHRKGGLSLDDYAVSHKRGVDVTAALPNGTTDTVLSGLTNVDPMNFVVRQISASLSKLSERTRPAPNLTDEKLDILIALMQQLIATTAGVGTSVQQGISQSNTKTLKAAVTYTSKLLDTALPKPAPRPLKPMEINVSKYMSNNPAFA